MRGHNGILLSILHSAGVRHNTLWPSCMPVMAWHIWLRNLFAVARYTFISFMEIIWRAYEENLAAAIRSCSPQHTEKAVRINDEQESRRAGELFFHRYFGTYRGRHNKLIKCEIYGARDQDEMKRMLDEGKHGMCVVGPMNGRLVYCLCDV